MPATIFCFRYRHTCMRSTECDFRCEANRMPEESTVNDEEDIANYILETVRELDEAYSRNRPLHELLRELLAQKYGVQTVDELDEGALEEFETDVVNLKQRNNNKSCQSPSNMFNEILASKYGVQSVHELTKDDIEELEEDLEMLVEIMTGPFTINYNNGNNKVLMFRKSNIKETD